MALQHNSKISNINAVGLHQRCLRTEIGLGRGSKTRGSTLRACGSGGQTFFLKGPFRPVKMTLAKRKTKRRMVVCKGDCVEERGV